MKNSNHEYLFASALLAVFFIETQQQDQRKFFLITQCNPWAGRDKPASGGKEQSSSGPIHVSQARRTLVSKHKDRKESYSTGRLAGRGTLL
jgi:hypothetical protein